MKDLREIEDRIRKIRKLTLTAIYHAGSGHPGGSLSAAEILGTLYFYKMRVDPKHPDWESRDRFVLSKGHACPALYATLAEKGYFPVSELEQLREVDSWLQGHPDMKHTKGIDMSTGSLGQGISAAVGIAYGGKLNGKAYKVYCLLGDGECEEGQVWEAVMSAAHFHLDNLVAIIDHNHLQIDGTNEEVMDVASLAEKFTANHWHVLQVNGNSVTELIEALDEKHVADGVPTVIIAETIKGKGVSFMENEVNWHGRGLNEAEYKSAMDELGGMD